MDKHITLIVLGVMLLLWQPKVSFGQYGPLSSSTDSVIVTNPNTVTDWGRGFRFQPTSDMWVIKIGKRVPAAGSYSWAIWDFATQTKVFGQTSLVNTPGQYVYEDCDSIIKLTSGRDYILELYGSGSAQYYFGTSSQIGTDMTYLDMRYCASCNSTTYPTNVLNNYHYGTPDFLYTLQIAPPNNAGVDTLINPEGSGDFCSGKQLVVVRVSNLGNNALSNVDVDWKLNGVVQTGQSLTFNPPLDSIAGPNNSTLVTLGTVDFPFQTPIHVEAWTSNPNGVADTRPSDDSLDLYVTSNKQGVIAKISPGDTFICAGSQVTLNTNDQPSGVTFNWNTQATSQSIIVHRTGQYSVTVTSAQGCTDVDTVNIVLYPVPDPGDFGIVDNGNGNFTFTPVRVQNTTDYIWDFGDGDTVIAQTNTPQHHQYTQIGTYSVSLTVVAGCLDNSATISKQVFYEGNLTGIQTANNLLDGVNIFPNPAKDELNLSAKASNTNLQSVTIYDVLGKKVLQSALDGKTAEISISSLPSGNYLVQIATDKGFVLRKLTVRR